MRVGQLKSVISDAQMAFRSFVSRPTTFTNAFDDLTPEERMAIIADLAEVSRLTVTMIELVGDYYRGDE